MDVRDSTSESLETFRKIENLEPPFEASSFVRSPCTLVLRFVETWASCRSQTGRFGAASLLGRVAARRRERTGGEQWTVPRLSAGFNYSAGRGIRSLVSRGGKGEAVLGPRDGEFSF